MIILICRRYETGVNEVFIKDSYSDAEQYAASHSEHMEDIWWIVEPKKLHRIEFAMMHEVKTIKDLRDEL